MNEVITGDMIGEIRVGGTACQIRCGFEMRMSLAMQQCNDAQLAGQTSGDPTGWDDQMANETLQRATVLTKVGAWKI